MFPGFPTFREHGYRKQFSWLTNPRPKAWGKSRGQKDICSNFLHFARLIKKHFPRTRTFENSTGGEGWLETLYISCILDYYLTYFLFLNLFPQFFLPNLLVPSRLVRLCIQPGNNVSTLMFSI